MAELLHALAESPQTEVSSAFHRHTPQLLSPADHKLGLLPARFGADSFYASASLVRARRDLGLLLPHASLGSRKALFLCLLGPPASGKATCASLIADRLNLIALSLDNVLDAEVAAGSSLGTRVREYVVNRRPVPEQLATRCVLKHLMSSEAMLRGVCLHGFPRTLTQAAALVKQVSNLHLTTLGAMS